MNWKSVAFLVQVSTLVVLGLWAYGGLAAEDGMRLLTIQAIIVALVLLFKGGD